ncbi:MAG: biopolymer transporter ExbD, partial [Myxococcota bacterium]
ADTGPDQTQTGLQQTGLEQIEVTPEGFRASYDVTLFVRKDGNLFLEDNVVLDIDVSREVARLAAERGPSARVVVASDGGAPFSRIVQVLDLVQQAGVGRVGLEIGAAAPAADPLFPGVDLTEVVNLDQEQYAENFDSVKPRRHKFPQNPYGSTDFTAYTREWGEAKLGLANISYGIAPRVQIGTSPSLDAIGMFNASGKGNFLRFGPYDAALSASVYVVPITNLLRSVDPDREYNIAGYAVNDEEIFVDRVTYVSVALQNSLQLWKGWSVHGGIGYARAGAKGNLDFYNLPVVVLPGLEDLGGEVAVVPSVVGELVDLRFATDYRFNRRDSIIFQAAETVYGSARGAVTANFEELPTEVEGLNNLDFVVRYDGWIPWYRTARASLSWQFSWQRVDLRFGWGVSALPWSWALQALDLSYRFGGTTRRTETQIRKNYNQDKKELEIIDDIQFDDPGQAPPPPPPEDELPEPE